jgi:hypothetical protein
MRRKQDTCDTEGLREERCSITIQLQSVQKNAENATYSADATAAYRKCRESILAILNTVIYTGTQTVR